MGDQLKTRIIERERDEEIHSLLMSYNYFGLHTGPKSDRYSITYSIHINSKLGKGPEARKRSREGA